MALLLYKVKKAYRWYPEPAAGFLASDDVPADSVGDIQTRDNLLSEWEVEEDRSNILRVVRAIAIGSDRIDDAGYVLFDSRRLADCGIELKVTEGSTADTNINSRHRDLVLSRKKLVALAALFLRHGELGEIMKLELQASVIEDIQNGELPEKCRKKVK